MGKTTVACSLSTLRAGDSNVVDRHITVERDGVVGRRGRVDTLAGGSITRRDDGCGTVANEGPGDGTNSGDDDSHSREEVDARAEHGDSDGARVCDRAGVVDEK